MTVFPVLEVNTWRLSMAREFVCGCLPVYPVLPPCFSSPQFLSLYLDLKANSHFFSYKKSDLSKEITISFMVLD